MAAKRPAIPYAASADKAGTLSKEEQDAIASQVLASLADDEWNSGS